MEQNIRAVAEMTEQNKDRCDSFIEDLLAEFSISHLRRTPALALSGGSGEDSRLLGHSHLNPTLFCSMNR